MEVIEESDFNPNISKGANRQIRTVNKNLSEISLQSLFQQSLKSILKFT